MMKNTDCKLRRSGIRTINSGVNIWQPLLLFALFVAGSAAGSLAGASQVGKAAAESVFLDNGSVYGVGGYFELLFLCSKYHLFVLICGTSLLGVIFIPAALAFRGFVLSCTAASILAAYPDKGIILTAVVLGLPSLLTVPTLFILGIDSFRFSSRLLSLYDRRPPPQPADHGADFLISAAALLFAAAVEFFVIPQLINLIL